MRLIDADALREKLELKLFKMQIVPMRLVLETINEQPTVDAVPVVHGYWTKDNRCSECGADIPSDSWRDYIDKSECHYCYSCGAKMDGDENAER